MQNYLSTLYVYMYTLVHTNIQMYIYYEVCLRASEKLLLSAGIIKSSLSTTKIVKELNIYMYIWVYFSIPLIVAVVIIVLSRIFPEYVNIIIIFINKIAKIQQEQQLATEMQFWRRPTESKKKMLHLFTCICVHVCMYACM